MNNDGPKIYSLGILEEKTYTFALRIIKAYSFLTKNNEYVLSKQLLRSGTSIGANYREATYAQSKMDFVNKLSIALKETNETIYWLELLHDGEYIDEKTFNSIHNEADEITAILASIVKSTKENTEKYDNAKGIFLNS